MTVAAANCMDFGHEAQLYGGPFEQAIDATGSWVSPSGSFLPDVNQVLQIAPASPRAIKHVWPPEGVSFPADKNIRQAVYYYPTVVSSPSTVDLLAIGTTTSRLHGRVQHRNDGKIHLIDATGSSVWSSTSALPSSGWYLIQFGLNMQNYSPPFIVGGARIAIYTLDLDAGSTLWEDSGLVYGDFFNASGNLYAYTFGVVAGVFNPQTFQLYLGPLETGKGILWTTSDIYRDFVCRDYVIDLNSATPDYGSVLDNGQWDDTGGRPPSTASYAEYTGIGDKGVCEARHSDGGDVGHGPHQDARQAGRIIGAGWAWLVQGGAGATIRTWHGGDNGSDGTSGTSRGVNTSWRWYRSYATAGDGACPTHLEYPQAGFEYQSDTGFATNVRCAGICMTVMREWVPPLRRRRAYHNREAEAKVI